MTRRRLSPSERVAIAPLTPQEQGRGVIISKDREAEIAGECLRLLRAGVVQKDIAKMLGASRSRVSRWCLAAVSAASVPTDSRLVNGRSQTLPQMVRARLLDGDPRECWDWLGFVKPNGYGSLNYKGKTYQAHRAAYEVLVGPIPAGLVVDHICRNRRCCNPSHLQCISQSENLYLAKVRSR